MSTEIRPDRFVFPSPTDVVCAAQRLPLAPLVDLETQRWIAELTRDLPVPVQTVCYECRLRQGDRRVDLALCMLPPFAEQARFSALLDELASSHERDPHWLRTTQFLRSWAAEAPGYRPEFPFVWLAFDLERHMRALPAPCPAPCVDADFFARRLGAKLPPQPASALAVVARTCHEAFFGHAIPEEVERTFLRCLSVEGVSVRAQHFSFMLSREPATFKLDVQLPVHQVRQFLTAVAWPGPAARIEAGIRSYMPWDGQVQLNLVLSPRLTPPLEVEFLSGGQQIATTDRLAFVERMVESGLCAPEKAGVLREIAEQRLLRAVDACENDLALNWYVKIRFQEAAAAEAKAYLGLMPRLRRATQGAE